MKLKKYLYLILAFAVPALGLLAVYILMGFYPFGNGSVLVMDMSGQNVEFFSALRRIVLGGEYPFYSWSKVLGGNFIGIFAYHLASPFSFITLLFPAANLAEALMVLGILKVGLAGSTMALLLRRLYNLRTAMTTMFATCYALMSYVGVYLISIMWIDGLIFLPLVVLGIERLLAQGRYKLLYFSLLASIVSNYYIGYMICIFSAMYFMFRYVSENEIFGFKKFVRKAGLFAGTALLSVGTSAALLLPTFYTLMSNKLVNKMDLTRVNLEFGTQDFFAKLFVGAYDSLTNFGLPNIFFGVAAQILFILYFINKGINRREKLAAALLTLFLYASMNIDLLNKFWHGFQPPVWFPYRFSFLFSFIAILLSVRSFLEIKHIPVWRIGFTGFVLEVLIMSYFNYPARYINNTAVLITACLVVVFTSVLIIAASPDANRKITPKSLVTIVSILVFLTAGEMTLNGYLLTKGIHKEFYYIRRSYYIDHKYSVNQLLDGIRSRDDSLFYRIESVKPRNSNDPMGFGYYGVSHYSSAFEGANLKLLRNLGFQQMHYILNYTGSTLVTDALFGIKYIMSPTNLPYPYEVLFEKNDQIVYKNPFALPLGFAASSEALKYDQAAPDALIAQNDLLRSMLPDYYRYEDFFKKIDYSSYQDPETGSNVLYFVSNNDGPVYMNSPSGKDKAVALSVNYQQYYQPFSFGNTNTCLGSFPAGTPVEILISPLVPGVEYEPPVLYYLDMPLFYGALGTLQWQPLELTEFRENHIEGKVTTVEGQIILTTVSYDKGWKMKVDGRPVETKAAAGALLAAEVPAGTHTVEITFHPMWLSQGLMISGLSILIFIPAVLVSRRRVREKQQ